MATADESEVRQLACAGRQDCRSKSLSAQSRVFLGQNYGKFCQQREKEKKTGDFVPCGFNACDLFFLFLLLLLPFTLC